MLSKIYGLKNIIYKHLWSVFTKCVGSSFAFKLTVNTKSSVCVGDKQFCEKNFTILKFSLRSNRFVRK